MISENTILKKLIEKQKITQCRNSSKSHRRIVERGEIDTPNTQIFVLYFRLVLFCLFVCLLLLTHKYLFYISDLL
jgi:hypothetical protein